jgi:predicted PhzF superfamily epimerase YddE/YHI9
MNFAGHPTVGPAFVSVRQGYVSPQSQTFCVEENVGAIPAIVDQEEHSIF